MTRGSLQVHASASTMERFAYLRIGTLFGKLEKNHTPVKVAKAGTKKHGHSAFLVLVPRAGQLLFPNCADKPTEFVLAEADRVVAFPDHGQHGVEFQSSRHCGFHLLLACSFL